MNKTKTVKVSQITRNWHLIDAQDQILGRMAVGAAGLLTGKDKPYFVNHLDCGDFVVVINAAKVRLTGRKETQKKYYRHSGYPGGFKEISVAKQREKDPRQIVHHAVSGMLPKNKLQDKRLSRLKIFAGDEHPYQDKFKSQNEKPKTKT